MKKSRYIISAKSKDNKYNIFYNLRNGKGLKVDKKIDIWNQNSIEPYLKKHKFLLSENEDETLDVINDYHTFRKEETLHLIILPHENCNFRCVYCYEKFEKNKMKPEIVQGIIKYVEKQLKSRDYKLFTVSWFGGEPLLGIDVMETLSESFLELCQRYNVVYSAGITTNGSLITEKNFRRLCEMKVTNYQITIDGIKEIHDQQRIMVNGRGTYDLILKNLKMMKNSNDLFKVLVRMNVSPENYKAADEHIEQMDKLFSRDERFKLYFHNVGHWGGTNDDKVEVCEENMMVNLLEKSSLMGIPTFSGKKLIKPNNQCYAANPKSFVIGTDGNLYKCTVALYNEKNNVGKLSVDGDLLLNENLMKLWTEGGINDKGCQSCFFAPSCHGDSCPLIRVETSKRPCPDWKNSISDIVSLMDIQNEPFDVVKLR